MLLSRLLLSFARSQLEQYSQALGNYVVLGAQVYFYRDMFPLLIFQVIGCVSRGAFFIIFLFFSPARSCALCLVGLPSSVILQASSPRILRRYRGNLPSLFPV